MAQSPRTPKNAVKVRRLAVGSRVRIPASIERFVGKSREQVTFYVPGMGTNRLTIDSRHVPGAADLEPGDPYDLKGSVTLIRDDQAIVSVDGYSLARHRVPTAKLNPE